jgi:hypothetical protein
MKMSILMTRVACDIDGREFLSATHFWSIVWERLLTSESSIKALSKADEKACAMVLEVTVNATIRRFANIGKRTTEAGLSASTRDPGQTSCVVIV